MSTEMAVATGEVVGPEPTLGELGATARREYEAGVAVAGEALQHWFAAGEALLQARRLVAPGEWLRWVEHNFDGQRCRAQVLMRFATYRPQIEAEGIKEIDRVSAYLRGMPDANPRGRPKDDARAAEGVRLRKEGMTYRQIGELFGVAPNTVMRWNNPEKYRIKGRENMARSRARRRAEIEAQRRTVRDKAMRKVGGAVAESYALMRRTLQALDRAHSEASDREVRAALNAAIAKLHNAEDEIVRALGVQ
jgi:transposase